MVVGRRSNHDWSTRPSGGSVDRDCYCSGGAADSLCLLGAASSDGPELFQGATFIQRVRTVGDNASAGPGAVVGKLANVPYTAEYLFYRGH